MVVCPTCGATGTQQCVRGRKPSAVWQKQIPFPEGHDSRRTEEKRKAMQEYMEWDNTQLMALADMIGARIAAGNLPPQDENGFYIFTQETLGLK